MVNKLLATIIVLGVAIILSIVVSAVIISQDSPDLASAIDLSPVPTETTFPMDTVSPPSTGRLVTAHSPTVDASQDVLCVHTVTYWVQNPKLWPELFNISGFGYTKEIMQEVFATQNRDLPTELLVQLHAAYMNTLHAKANLIVSQAIVATADWLNAHPAGGEINAADLKTGGSLGTILSEYNNGHLGYDSCADNPSPRQIDSFTLPTAGAPAPTVLPIGTEALSFTVMPVGTSSQLPTFTSTPKERRRRPGSPPPNTPVPPPPTQIPPPTPAPTKVPLPTPAPAL